MEKKKQGEREREREDREREDRERERDKEREKERQRAKKMVRVPSSVRPGLQTGPSTHPPNPKTHYTASQILLLRSTPSVSVNFRI